MHPIRVLNSVACMGLVAILALWASPDAAARKAEQPDCPELLMVRAPVRGIVPSPDGKIYRSG